MILCDVGNTRMHFLDGDALFHMRYEEGLSTFGTKEVCYICVSEKARALIDSRAPKWRAVKGGTLSTNYQGLGIDREAACIGVGEEGVVVDAGTAITVDIMKKGRHEGGWIWPGLASLRDAYESIAPVLSQPVRSDVPLRRLPQNTFEAVNFGIFGAITALIERFSGKGPIVVTGGDADVVAKAIPQAIVDERVVFKGMKKLIKDENC